MLYTRPTLHCNINNHATLSCSCLELFLFFVFVGSWIKLFLNKSRSIYKSLRCYVCEWKIGFKIGSFKFVKSLKECDIWLFQLALKNSKFPFFIYVLFFPFSKKSQLTPLKFPQYESAIWDRKPILVHDKQVTNHIM